MIGYWNRAEEDASGSELPKPPEVAGGAEYIHKYPDAKHTSFRMQALRASPWAVPGAQGPPKRWTCDKSASDEDVVVALQMPTQPEALGRRTEEECSAKLAQGVPFGPIIPSAEAPERDRDADLCLKAAHADQTSALNAPPQQAMLRCPYGWMAEHHIGL
ncbi:hypothetical protein PGT21_026128 [Puccinia graminis f. sp. tritici]|uniref:Uncharacterized protein n=1 Tax=Puccinia graminis f. sp. tritici TaxID=56615 RepID=A0A5B0QJG6_PUCGR|nr:hypothetical protein PGT21_026128 [Puccinia graminis f. sp. tritici]